MQKIKTYAFTLVELIVAITISTMVLGAVFFLMSNTINHSIEARLQSEFLKNFYAFTGVFETGNISILQDNTVGKYDIGLVTTSGISGGIVFGIIDTNTKKLIPPTDAGTYLSSVFGYRTVSAEELNAIEASGISLYDLEFQNDKILRDFYMRDLQMEEFNNGGIIDMGIEVFLQFVPSYIGEDWDSLPQEYIYSYTLAF